MQKQISPLDLLTKSSIGSFLIETPSESLLVIPGVYFNLPGKFFRYYDVVDVTLKVMRVSEDSKAMVDMDEFKEAIAPKALDLNKFFTELEEEIEEKDVFGLNEKVVENKELPQPSVPTIGELEPSQKTEEEADENSEDKENVETENNTEEKPQTYSKKQYNSKKYYNKSNVYRKNYYGKDYQNKSTYANSNTTANGKKTYNSYKKSYNKYYKKSENE